MKEFNIVEFSAEKFNDFYMFKHDHFHFMVKEMGGVATLVIFHLIVVDVNCDIDPYRDNYGLCLNVMVIYWGREDYIIKPTTYALLQLMDNRKKCIYLRRAILEMFLT